jgi:hypothetical protein
MAMKIQPIMLQSFHARVLGALLFTALVCGATSLAQTNVEYITYGFWEEQPAWILVNGDSLRTGQFDFYDIGKNADSEDATTRCTQHNLYRAGAELTVHVLCNRFYLGGGTHQFIAAADGDRFVWKTLSGTGRYANVSCEGEVRPAVWQAHRFQMLPARWTNHMTGTCTTMED